MVKDLLRVFDNQLIKIFLVTMDSEGPSPLSQNPTNGVILSELTSSQGTLFLARQARDATAVNNKKCEMSDTSLFRYHFHTIFPVSKQFNYSSTVYFKKNPDEKQALSLVQIN
jgi:hypothetical protein